MVNAIVCQNCIKAMIQRRAFFRQQIREENGICAGIDHDGLIAFAV